ncbi:MAG: tetratricopeptide repeat protein [Promethearchaeota archaeon]|jgi:tetratricopeptide (TPR) repeat protein
MSNPRPEQLVYAEELLSKGKIKQALEITAKYEGTSHPYFFKGDHDKALEIRLQCKDMYEKIGYKSSIAQNFHLLGHTYLQIGQRNEGLNCAKKSLELYEQLNDRTGIASSYSLLGLAYNYKGNLDLAIDFSKQSLAISEIDTERKLDSLNNLVMVYILRGEVSKALEYAEQGQKLAQEINNDYMNAFLLYHISIIYLVKQNLDRAFEYLNKSLIYARKARYTWVIVWALFMYVRTYISLNERKKAEEYMVEMQEHIDKTRDKSLISLGLIAKGFILKSSGRSRDRAEAEKLVKQIVVDDITNPVVYLNGLTFMCEFLIEELEISNNLEIISELDPIITRFLNIAEKIHSYMYLSLIQVFQAKLALIQMKIDEAQLLLTKAQKTAEQHGFQITAQITSLDHDKLLEQLSTWKQLEKNNAPLSERIKLASFDSIINRMRRTNETKSPEVQKEEPILLLIMDNSGSTYFNHPFIADWDYSDLFSSFMSAFNTFSSEIFSKSIDRIRIGDNTILINPIESFLVCYVIKGQSYPAQQKLSRFSNVVRENSEIWQALNKSVKTSEILGIEKLKTVINEIFS